MLEFSKKFSFLDKFYLFFVWFEIVMYRQTTLCGLFKV